MLTFGLSSNFWFEQQLQQDLFGMSTKPRTLHLHIGIPKTASSWLQARIFPHLDHLLYLDSPQGDLFQGSDDLDDGRWTMRSVFMRSSHIWHRFGDAIFAELLGDRDSWLKDGRDLLISDERVGRQGSRPALLAAHMRGLQRKAVDWGFDRLNIVFLTRRQDHWLASHYAQVSDRNAKASQADFERLVREVTSPQLARYGFGSLLDYDVLYDLLCDAVGVENVTVLPYEALKADPSAFLNSLLAQLGTSRAKINDVCNESAGSTANVRSSTGSWELRPTSSVSRWAALTRLRRRLPRGTIKLTPDISQRVFDAYALGNTRFAYTSGLDLQRHGYFGESAGLAKSDATRWTGSADFRRHCKAGSPELPSFGSP